MDNEYKQAQMIKINKSLLENKGRRGNNTY